MCSCLNRIIIFDFVFRFVFVVFYFPSYASVASSPVGLFVFLLVFQVSFWTT